MLPLSLREEFCSLCVLALLGVTDPCVSDQLIQRRDSYPLSSELRVPTGHLSTALHLPKAFLNTLERTQTLHNRCGDTVEPELILGVDARNLKLALRILVAALKRMAVRWRFEK